MKNSLFTGILMISIISWSCRENITVNPPDETPLGTVGLLLSSAPQDIAQVKATLTRSGFETHRLLLAISDPQSSATGTFSDLVSGIWHLDVDALDDSGTVRYTGETDVEVVSGQTSRVNLQLHPASGSIEITVSWGTNLLVNGSFETGPWVGTYLPVDSGSTDISGWLVTKGPVDIAAYWESYQGSRSIDLDGESSFGAIQQSFPTIPGGTYTVRYAFAGNPEGLPEIKRMRVSAAGGHEDVSFDVSGKSIEDLGWTIHSWSFLATNSITTLSFASLDTVDGTYGPAIDDVVVTRTH